MGREFDSQMTDIEFAKNKERLEIYEKFSNVILGK